MKCLSPRHSISLFCHEIFKSQTYYQSVSRLEHFITKQTDTMSEIWPFHDKTDWYYVWGLTILWYNRLTLCLGIDHFMTKQTDTILGLEHFLTTQTDTMSGTWPFHDKTDWYYVRGLSISSQNRLILCLRFVHFSSSPRHSISLFCHKIFKSQTYYQSVLAWNGQAPDIVSVCFIMKWWSPRNSISLFCHEMVKPQT
jgi:hypothetical protein